MAWELPDTEREHAEYERNTLELVVGELRYFSIPKIESLIDDLHEAVHAEFPDLQQGAARSINVNADASNVDVQEDKQWVFRDKEQSKRVILRRSGLILESHNHRSREEFAASFSFFLTCLGDIAKVTPRRFGLRYINRISRAAVASQLQTDVSWSDLICDDFLKIPCDLATPDGTQLVSEIRSALPPGGLTLRYGLHPRDDVFTLDVDRFLDDEVKPDAVERLIVEFANDIFRVFAAVAANQLWTWMGEPHD